MWPNSWQASLKAVAYDMSPLETSLWTRWELSQTLNEHWSKEISF